MNRKVGPGPGFIWYENKSWSRLLDWLDQDGHPWWSFRGNVRSWWAIRELPNGHIVHFANLKRDMPGEIRNIAEFPGITVDEAEWESILLHCSFDYTKANATRSVPLGGAFWNGGAQIFMHKAPWPLA